MVKHFTSVKMEKASGFLGWEIEKWVRRGIGDGEKGEEADPGSREAQAGTQRLRRRWAGEDGILAASPHGIGPKS